MASGLLRGLLRVVGGGLGKGALAVAGAILPGIVSKAASKVTAVVNRKVGVPVADKSGEVDAIRAWFLQAPPAAVLVVAAIPVILSLLGWGRTEVPVEAAVVVPGPASKAV